jgi:hypothetical protein
MSIDPMNDPVINPAGLKGIRITMPDFEIICPKCGVDISLELGRADHIYVKTEDGCVRCSKCGGIAVNPSQGNAPFKNVDAHPGVPNLLRDYDEMRKKLGM